MSGMAGPWLSFRIPVGLGLGLAGIYGGTNTVALTEPRVPVVSTLAQLLSLSREVE